MRKKFMAGAAILALLMNSPQVSADNDIVIFGGEFEDDKTPSSQKKSEKPEPKKPVEKPATPPKAKAPQNKTPTQPIKQNEESAPPPKAEVPQDKTLPKPEIVEPQNKTPTQPIEQNEEAAPPTKAKAPQDKPLPKPEVVEPQNKPPTQPIKQNEEPAPPPKAEVPQDKSISKPEIVEPQSKPPTQPIKQNEESAPPPKAEVPQDKTLPKPEIVEPQNKTPTQPIKQNEEPAMPPKAEVPQDNPPAHSIEELPLEIDRPFEYPTEISGEKKPVESTRKYFSSVNKTQPPKELKILKPRFIKLAVDETYTYYLDKTSVQWKRVPYLANEYMADVWVRMIERNPSRLDNDMENYGAENFKAEVEMVHEQGYQYSPEDLNVLRQQNYILEHYYLRPKTKQIQFLCELEIFGRPQNAINERAYDNKNWENLVPGSVESAIYNATIKIIGKSKASERGHMTFIDMLDEYARIALN